MGFIATIIIHHTKFSKNVDFNEKKRVKNYYLLALAEIHIVNPNQ